MSREVFSFLTRRWDVDTAREILERKPRDPVQLPVAFIEPFLPAIRINEAHLPNVDVSKPVILVPIDGGYMLIDGWHRATRALRDGRHSVPAYALTRAEERKVRR